jgi:hypothetical protein
MQKFTPVTADLITSVSFAKQVRPAAGNENPAECCVQLPPSLRRRSNIATPLLLASRWPSLFMSAVEPFIIHSIGICSFRNRESQRERTSDRNCCLRNCRCSDLRLPACGAYRRRQGRLRSSWRHGIRRITSVYPIDTLVSLFIVHMTNPLSHHNNSYS